MNKYTVNFVLLSFFSTVALLSHAQTFTITPVPSENGTYTITPKLPADGKVNNGTVLTVTAKPEKGYSLDAIYYRIKGGMWGTLDFENFTPTYKITVDKDMSIGATFIESDLVNNLKVTQDVVYAKPGVKTLKYDVYSPKGAKNLPCIVIIHGGGWSSNNEDIMRGLARELTKANKYVVFSIDYRWVNKLDGDAQPTYMHQLIEDVFGAIAHIQEHAAQYGGDATRIAVTGDSAGGHLAEAAATLCTMIGDKGFAQLDQGTYEYMPSYIPKGKTVGQVKTEITNAIKAVAPSYGPSKAADFKQFIEQTDEYYYNAVSPLMHVPNKRERKIPHFIVRGTQDPIITDAMITEYVDMLKATEQRVMYVEVDGAGHAFFDWKPDAQTIGTFKKYGVKYAGEMRNFFDSVFYDKN